MRQWRGGHWTAQQTLCVWIVVIVWSNHVAECNALGIDPLKCKSIIDAYPVHICKEFREWMAKEYPQLILVYVPASCTSAMQIADCVQ